MKPSAGADGEFDEYLAEVPFDGAGADEQFRSDFGVGTSVTGQSGDVLLLRGQIVDGVDVAFTDLFAGGDQLSPCALAEGIGADRREQVVGAAQLVAGVHSSVLTAKPLAVEQVGAGELGPQWRTAEPLHRVRVVVLGLVASAEERLRARLVPCGPTGPADGCHARQPSQSIGPPPGLS